MKKPFFPNLPILVLLLSSSFFVQAQKTPSGKPPSLGVNMDKVELLYRSIEVNRTSTSPVFGMRSRRYMTEFPFLRVNGGELLEIDTRGQVFAPYLNKCPGAQKEITLFTKESRLASTFMWVGCGAGSLILLGGVLATGASGGESSTPFYTSLGIGFGAILTGVILARVRAQKAKNHLDSGVRFYNNSCYKPAPSAPNVPLANQADSTRTQAAPNDGITHDFKDTAYYDLLRNDPDKLAWWTAGFNPANLVFSNSHGFSYRTGVDFSYQKGSKFGLQGCFNYALVNNLAEYSYTGGDPDLETTYDDVAVDSDYKKGMRGQLVAWFKIGGKIVTKEEEVSLGPDYVYGRNVHTYTKINTKMHKGWAARAGVEYFQSILQNSDSGLPFQSDAPATATGPFELGNAAVMMRSVSLTLGISRRKINDIKIDLINTKLKGEKEATSLGEWYADLMYAPSIQLGDVNYYDFVGSLGDPEHELYPIDVTATALNNLGVRLGYRKSYIMKGFGLGFYFEVGSRPGLKGDDVSVSLPNGYGELGAVLHWGGRIN